MEINGKKPQETARNSWKLVAMAIKGKKLQQKTSRKAKKWQELAKKIDGKKKKKGKKWQGIARNGKKW